MQWVSIGNYKNQPEQENVTFKILNSQWFPQSEYDY